MINLSELRVIEDTFFRSSLTYYKPSIYNLIERFFREENEYSEATLVKLKNFIKGDPDMAFNKILKKDIDRLYREIKDTPKQFDEQLWRDMLPKIRERVKSILGMDFKPRSVFFYDSFPEGLLSFEKKGASSATVFEGNKDAGVYFLNKRISSYFTPILLIHEQLHTCLSQNKTREQMYIEWFEEGLCQWYSVKIYSELTKNRDIIELYRERCRTYREVKDEHNFTRRYFEYMKIMARLFLHGGEALIGKILVEYMSGKREAVNRHLDVSRLAIRHLPSNEIENTLANFTFFVEPEKLPPVEYLILRESLKPKGIEEIARKVKAPKELVAKATIALGMKGMVVVGEKVEINWRKRDLLDKGLIRPYWPLNS